MNIIQNLTREERGELNELIQEGRRLFPMHGPPVDTRSWKRAEIHCSNPNDFARVAKIEVHISPFLLETTARSHSAHS